MRIDWKRKLTSRKFWAAVVGFVSMLLVALGKDAGEAQTITGLIMAGASVVAYIFGEGLADSGGDKFTSNYGVRVLPEIEELPKESEGE